MIQTNRDDNEHFSRVNIAYDGHIFRWQNVGGVSRYLREVIARLPDEWTPTIFGVESELDGLPRHPHLKVFPPSAIRPRRWTQAFTLAHWKREVLAKTQVLHPTYYNLTGGLTYADVKCPVVVTVHDFIGATYPHLEDGSANTIQIQNQALKRADVLICISRYTEEDLLRRYPDAKGRTTVIPHGATFPVSMESGAQELFEIPSFLFVGSRGTYKNFLFLLRAFAKACEIHPRMRLRVAGRPLEMEEKWQIHFLGLTDRIDQSVYPSEAELHALYQRSVALLYPSRHEGFGIPPLEAMACGSVAISSNATSLPEVVGDAGILLDPTDEDAWTEAMVEIAKGGGQRTELVERGRKRAAVFSWERTAELHQQIYRQFA